MSEDVYLVVKEVGVPIAAALVTAWVTVKQAISRLDTKVETLEDAQKTHAKETKELVKVLGELSVVLGKLEVRIESYNRDVVRLEGKVEGA